MRFTRFSKINEDGLKIHHENLASKFNGGKKW